MLPTTTRRVEAHSSAAITERHLAEAEERLARLARDPIAIDRRLEELEYEWDIERTLEANASTIALIGLGLAATVDRRFAILPAVVAGFLLQHAVQGWCPPVPAFRRLGVRTMREIDEERTALKALRGDFRDVPPDAGAGPSMRARAALIAARA